MIFNKQDLFCDYSATSNVLKFHQEYKFLKEEWIFLGEETQICEFYKDILNINKIYRVDKNNYSPYQIHKSYPSARSFYLQTIWVCIGENIFLTYKDENKSYVKFKNDRLNFLDIGDIFITSKEIYENKYKSIHNSLILLEIGHILYNIEYISQCYGMKISIDSCEDDFNVVKVRTRRVPNNSNLLSIEKFKLLASFRNSGSYRNKIMNIDSKVKENIYISSIDILLKFRDLFQYDFEESVKTLVFINDGTKFINLEFMIIISYEQLNREYYFIDFRTASQYTLFLITKNNKKNIRYTDLLLYMGYLAQEICLKNSKDGVYNRPVKQVIQPFWKNVLNNLFKDYIPFYGVITGKESKILSEDDI